MKKRNNNLAFTLVELLVVISIIGVLSSTVFASLTSARQRAKNALKKEQMAIMLKSVEQLYHQGGAVPVNPNSPFWCTIGVNYNGNVCLSELVANSFLPNLPNSPDVNVYWYYYSVASNVAMIASVMIPEEYGPGTTQWHCSDAQGGVPGSKFYCLETVLK
jgi:prepilin-type N-terminal cleavage/methylation domain-containing protein